MSSVRPAEANAENPAFCFFAKMSSPSDSPPLSEERLGGTVSPALSLAKSRIIENKILAWTYQKSSSPFLDFFPLFLGGIVNLEGCLTHRFGASLVLQTKPNMDIC